MYRDLLEESSHLYPILLNLDRELARQARKGGCLFCGCKLHQANYPRKPRGAPVAGQGAWHFLAAVPGTSWQRCSELAAVGPGAHTIGFLEGAVKRGLALVADRLGDGAGTLILTQEVAGPLHA